MTFIIGKGPRCLFVYTGNTAPKKRIFVKETVCLKSEKMNLWIVDLGGIKVEIMKIMSVSDLYTFFTDPDPYFLQYGSGSR